MAKFIFRRSFAAIFGGLAPIFAFVATRCKSNSMQALCGLAVGVLIGLAVVSLVLSRRSCSAAH